MAKKATKAAPVENPTTLEAALDLIATMRDRVEEMEGELREAVADKERAEEESSDADKAFSELEDQISLEHDGIIELARIHTKLKHGRYSEAIGDLDRLLQEVDCGGALRVSAVAVML